MSDTTALLVIDTQVAMFSDPGFMPYSSDVMIANIRGLIERARASGVDVIYLRHNDASYEPMSKGQPGWEILPEVAPHPGERVFDKQACDSFYGTGLGEHLASTGVSHLVVAGMQTELCIDTACRSALHRDFNVTLASDAHSTWNGETVTAEQIIAHHNRTLAGIPHPAKRISVQRSAEIAF
jgi:nicotinamidase-related amidase